MERFEVSFGIIIGTFFFNELDVRNKEKERIKDTLKIDGTCVYIREVRRKLFGRKDSLLIGLFLLHDTF